MTKQALSKAMLQLMQSQKQAFIVRLLLSLEKVYTEEVPTAAVNGKTIKVNPTWFESLPPKQRCYLLAHEAWHVATMDMFRRGNKCPDTWNKACDHYINLLLNGERDNTIEFIPGGLADKKYTGWEKEDIYNDLVQNGGKPNQFPDLAPTDGNGSGDGDAEGDPSDGGGSKTQGSMGTMAAEVSSLVQQAAMYTRMQGAEVPKCIQEYLDELYAPRLPWEQLLANYVVKATDCEDYSYAVPNKAMLPHGILLPSLQGEQVAHIAIANDTSSSVCDEDYQTYLAAIKDIKFRTNPQKMSVVSFTTCIEQEWEVNEDEDISKIKFRGWGGTDLHPVFNHFMQPKNKPSLLIVFSDLECSHITEQPPFEVIWVCVNNPHAKVNFGKLIHIKVDHA